MLWLSALSLIIDTSPAISDSAAAACFGFDDAAISVASPDASYASASGFRRHICRFRHYAGLFSRHAAFSPMLFAAAMKLIRHCWPRRRCRVFMRHAISSYAGRHYEGIS